MDKPISVGDLVMMVRGHSCVMKLLGGVPFTVRAFTHPFGGGWMCSRCGEYNAGPDERAAVGAPSHANLPLSWLKRIPPLDELDDVESDEEITA